MTTPPRPWTAPTTAQLLRRAAEHGTPDELAAVGLALQLFTEIAIPRCDLPATTVHRATTVLTKQIVRALTGADANGPGTLAAVLDLVVDPERIALPDGRTATAICGQAWPTVRSTARARADEILVGADDYGVVPVLRLAATRAVTPGQCWWGTAGWAARVERYLAGPGRRQGRRLALERTPEHLSEAELAELLGPFPLVVPGSGSPAARPIEPR